ncbi:MAG: flavin reductase family protein [Clostridia bacterium]|nr:flavin reductase family protein [Clostridia bacterium]
MKEANIEELSFNPFTIFSEKWMLLCAGDETAANAMTVSWGHLGSIWGGLGNATSIVYVRPQRYTRGFIETKDFYTLSVFLDGKRKELAYMGAHSGRDGDKMSACGLEYAYEDGIPYIKGADMVFICRKQYVSQLKEEGFLSPGTVSRNYPDRDFHYVYVGNIEKVLVKD